MMDERADRPEERAGTGRRRWTPQRVLMNALSVCDDLIRRGRQAV